MVPLAVSLQLTQQSFLAQILITLTELPLTPTGREICSKGAHPAAPQRFSLNRATFPFDL